jgi:hypothetical protein
MVCGKPDFETQKTRSHEKPFGNGDEIHQAWALRFVKEKLEFEGIECFLTDEGFERTDLSFRWVEPKSNVERRRTNRQAIAATY